MTHLLLVLAVHLDQLCPMLLLQVLHFSIVLDLQPLFQRLELFLLLPPELLQLALKPPLQLLLLFL